MTEPLTAAEPSTTDAPVADRERWRKRRREKEEDFMVRMRGTCEPGAVFGRF